MEAIDLEIGYHKTIAKGSFHFMSGNLVGLIGNNGSGKTTLLKTMAGFLKPIHGSILLNGKSVNEYSSSELAKKISIVTTGFVDFPILTVEEVVSLGRYPFTGQFGKLSQRDEEIVKSVMNECGVYEWKNKWIQELSDGERQKVFIAKSLAQESEVLLLDEPTSFLDVRSKVRLMSLLEKLVSLMKKKIFISTHDIPLIAQCANSFVLFSDADEWMVTEDKEKILEWQLSQR